MRVCYSGASRPEADAVAYWALVIRIFLKLPALFVVLSMNSFNKTRQMLVQYPEFFISVSISSQNAWCAVYIERNMMSKSEAEDLINLINERG